MIILCSLVLLLCAVLNFACWRDSLAPGVMQPALWGLLLLGAANAQQEYFQLSDSTLFLCVAASILFQTGFGIVVKVLPPTAAPAMPVNPQACLRFRNALFLAVILVLPFFLRTAYSMATTGPVDNMAFNLRYSLSEEGKGYGVWAYGVTLALYLVMLEAMFMQPGRRVRLFLAIALAAVFCVLMTGRTFLLALLIVALFPFVLSGRMSPGRALLFLLLVFLPSFYLYSVTLEKDGGGGIDSIAQVFRLYLFGGLFAFDKLTQSGLPPEEGAQLFRAFLAFLNAISPPAEVPPVVDDYAFIPEPTNVYTVFSKAYRDFGAIGVVVYMAFIGAVQGLVYRRARDGSPSFSLLLTFSYFALLMQFFQDHYLGILSTWAQVIVLTGLFAVVTRASRRARNGSPTAPRLPWPPATEIHHAK